MWSFICRPRNFMSIALHPHLLHGHARQSSGPFAPPFQCGQGCQFPSQVRASCVTPSFNRKVAHVLVAVTKTRRLHRFSLRVLARVTLLSDMWRFQVPVRATICVVSYKQRRTRVIICVASYVWCPTVLGRLFVWCPTSSVVPGRLFVWRRPTCAILLNSGDHLCGVVHALPYPGDY